MTDHDWQLILAAALMIAIPALVLIAAIGTHYAPSGELIGPGTIELLVLAGIFVALVFTMSIEHERRVACGIPMGESCSTDTECECLHGIGH